jgi:hypothetical protein
MRDDHKQRKAIELQTETQHARKGILIYGLLSYWSHPLRQEYPEICRIAFPIKGQSILELLYGILLSGSIS